MYIILKFYSNKFIFKKETMCFASGVSKKEKVMW